MKIKPIDDNNSDFSLVELKPVLGMKDKLKPSCKIHGAMLKVSHYIWRCVQADYFWSDETGGHRKIDRCEAGCMEVKP